MGTRFVVADVLGRPLCMILTGGEVHDVATAPELRSELAAGGVIVEWAK